MRKIAEHCWFDVGRIDCINLPYHVEIVELFSNVGEENIIQASESKWDEVIIQIMKVIGIS